ncbi:NAD(P)H-quinone oxidoreductase [Saccharibacillus sp. CPCC 101409]|uniref:NAD(P)H-quinone oxidoreductase n=1 Tax=Saccharibacillus sp. CPCC 101409 TaxID=3058041 RepID=UPI002672ECA7|nr:NAD(P)H-quinone oxidoreductase [Saccharibacillus sp. CPCC 101409]MDO3410923.1 NAD(P)H-quinone oxidoreductase [Saccharibacillus sp. CPCC 101409]
MKAIMIEQQENGNRLQLQNHPAPEPAAGELLIKVHAAAVNRTDIVTREGRSGYAVNPILGVEIAGVVEQADGESDFAPGDRVMGLVNGGGYAEYAVMPADRAMKIPAAYSFEQAAAVPEVFLTAYQTLYWLGRLQPNESVLIHAGASGVGTAAIQLAKKLSGAQVIVTAGSQDKLDFCRELGADVGIDYKKQSFDEEVLAATNGRGVDLILDFVGADYWDKNLASVAKEGRWVLIGILGGAQVERVNLFALMSKCVQLTATLLTPRSDEYKARLTSDFVRDVMPYMETGEIKPIIDTVFPLAEAMEAQRHMEDNRNIGKIVLKVD